LYAICNANSIISNILFLKEVTMKQNLIAVLLVFFLLSSPVFSNGSSEEREESTVVLRYQDWQLAEEPAGTTLKEIVADYNTKNPGIVIETEGVPFEQNVERFTIQFKSGMAPDVIRVAAETLPRLIEMGAILPINDLVEQEDASFLEPFYENAIKWGTIDGKLYGLPNRIDAQALYYNRAMYEAAGLNPDRGPSTWKELEENAKKLTVDKDGDGRPDQYGYQIIAARTSSTSGRLLRWFWDNGAKVFSDDLKKSLIDSPEAIEAFTFWIGLAEKGYVPPGAPSADFQVASNNFILEKTAHLASGPWTIGQILGANPDMKNKIGIAPLPNTGVNQGGGTFYAIPAGTKNVEKAWEFIKFATSRDNQVKWTVETRLLPGRKDAADDPAIANDPLLRNFFDGLGMTRPIAPVPQWREVEEALWDAVQAALVGIKTPEQALKDAKVAIDIILAR
jgi:ABC-type glycerol-3-phosphate transport system substrate-binding protein